MLICVSLTGIEGVGDNFPPPRLLRGSFCRGGWGDFGPFCARFNFGHFNCCHGSICKLVGMKEHKGNVHVQFGTPINDKIKGLSDIKNRNQLLKAVAEIIDKEIYQSYHLWNSNYVAYDLLHSTSKYTEMYDENGKEKFQDYMSERLKGLEANKDAENIFLKMYANPTINAKG